MLSGSHRSSNLVAFVVAAVGQCDELALAGGLLGELGRVGQLVPVVADVGDLVGAFSHNLDPYPPFELLPNLSSGVVRNAAETPRKKNPAAA